MTFLRLSFSIAILFCVIYNLVEGRAINRYEPGHIGSSDATGRVIFSSNSGVGVPYGSRTEPEIRFHSTHGQHKDLGYAIGRVGRGGRSGRHHHRHHDETNPQFEHQLMRELRRYLSGSRSRNQHTFVHGINRFGNQEAGVL